jgi:hypothetical protein
LRHTVLEKLCPDWLPWRRASNLPRHLGATAPSPFALIADHCFGRVAEHERLVLEESMAGDRRPTKPAAAAPPDQDSSDRVG